MIDEDEDGGAGDLSPSAQMAQEQVRFRGAELEADEARAAQNIPVDDQPDELTPEQLASLKSLHERLRDGHPIAQPGSAAQRRAALN